MLGTVRTEVCLIKQTVHRNEFPFTALRRRESEHKKEGEMKKLRV